MTLILKSYNLKIILPNENEYLNNFKNIVELATKQLLNKIWSEEWIKRLGTTINKAHSIVNPKQVFLEYNGQEIYLPSRVRMGIAERVGRILRSQYKRMNCFKDCLKIIEIIGLEISENKLVNLMTCTFRNKKLIPIYKKVLIEQTIRLIKNWHEKLGIDFQQLSYCELVQPRLLNFVFLYGPDDYRELKYEMINGKILYQIKLPITPCPQEKKEWQWITGELTIPAKLQEKIQKATNNHPKKPILILKTLKGGLIYFFLQFPWEFSKKERETKNRVLAVDLGLKKLATAVVCEKKKQISKPIYLRLKGKQYRYIERLYKHISGIQNQLASNPENHRVKEEKMRLYRKLKRIREELAHTTANLLIKSACDWQCIKIVLEDLRSIKPQKGRKKWSRQMNDWLRGRISELLERKCKEEGLKFQKVIPWGTSSHCPRCSTIGIIVLGPNNLTHKKGGRWFYCSECKFSADRDYIAAINIYRATFIDYKKIKSLKDTIPIPYMEIGKPSLNYSQRRTRDDPITNSLVVVTGGLTLSERREW